MRILLLTLVTLIATFAVRLASAIDGVPPVVESPSTTYNETNTPAIIVGGVASVWVVGGVSAVVIIAAVIVLVYCIYPTPTSTEE